MRSIAPACSDVLRRSAIRYGGASRKERAKPYHRLMLRDDVDAVQSELSRVNLPSKWSVPLAVVAGLLLNSYGVPKQHTARRDGAGVRRRV